MLTKDAIKFFGNQNRIALRLGISRAAVSKWGKVVPMKSATALEILSDGAVKVDFKQYPALRRAIRDAAEADRIG